MIRLGYVLLYVDDVLGTVDFYERAFGLEKGFLHESGDYGEARTGSTILGFVAHGTASSHGFRYRPTRIEEVAPGFEIGLVVEDVPRAFERAVTAGASVLSSPETKPWGQVVAYVRDQNGFIIELCTAMG